MNTFWEKYEKLCLDNGYTPTNAAKEIGVSTGTISGWRHGAKPNKAALKKVSSFFHVNVEYLVSDQIEVSMQPSQKTIGEKTLEVFSNLMSLSQRFISLRHGKPVEQNLLTEIARYVNTDIIYLLSDSAEYSPLNIEYDRSNLLNHRAYDEIMSLFDKCTDDDNKRKVQVQLSKIVLYWLEKEYNLNEIKQWNGTLVAKIDYIKYHKSHINTTTDFGFNYSELDYFREKSIEDGKNLSFQYMLTGQKEHIIDSLHDKIICLENQLIKYEK